MSLNTAELSKIARETLESINGIFPRVWSMLSVLLAIYLGMLAFLATNAPPWSSFTPVMTLVSSGTFVLIAIGLWHLYHGAFPRLEGGENSLIFFQQIAARREAVFIEEFRKLSDESYLDDLLGQAWRNSEILKKKYFHMKRSFQFLAGAILPWAVTLSLFVIASANRTSLLAK